jgi:diaminohydroxyphosphoribosylaminopyrimidine deaminase / 5-amino-6-(5-phosphoribosylamino)uracil reductase
MNIKRNNIHLFTRLAFEQAKINLGSTGKNPSVGAIVEKNGSVISSGCTSIKGRPHAEFNALNNNLSLKNTNLYVSLEPCTHYGKTPPCTDKIIKKKIKKVYYSVDDIDKRTSELAYKKLKKKKIHVKKGILNNYGQLFYKSYFLNHKKKLPMVDAKLAISKDFYTKNKISKWITNTHSRKRVHLLRSNYDCIISTSKSINEDDSKLDCRIEGLENKSPAIAIIDRKFKIRKNLSLFNINNSRKIIIFTTTTNKLKELYFKRKGVRIIKINKLNNNSDLKEILIKLMQLGFTRVLLESGVKMLKLMILNKIINTLYLFQSSKRVYSNGLNFCSNIIKKRINTSKKIRVNLFKDTLYKIRIK